MLAACLTSSEGQTALDVKKKKKKKERKYKCDNKNTQIQTKPCGLRRFFFTLVIIIAVSHTLVANFQRYKQTLH